MRKLIAILFILSCTIARAQDPQFSQFYFSQYAVGPSFAGNTDGGRVSLLVRNQWPSIPKEYITYNISGDYYLQQISSGLGIFFIQDRAGAGNLTTQNIGFQYSYNLQIRNTWSIKPGLQFLHQSRYIDYNSLIFGDQLSFAGTNPVSVETPTLEKISYFDFATSLLIQHNNPSIWFGFTLDHLATPNQSFIDVGKSFLPNTYKVYGGYKHYERGDRAKYKENSLNFMFLYKAQADFDQLDFGCYWIHQPVIVGLWYRGLPLVKSYKGHLNHDAMVFMFGYYNEKFSVVYSYDFTISLLKTNTGGANEITLNYLFNQNMKLKKKRKKVTIACPKYDPLMNIIK